MVRSAGRLLLIFDLLGTFVFALQGAVAAVRGDLDPIGIAVLAFVTACGGGIMRDLLIGAVPPAAIGDWRYVVTAFAAATIVFVAPAMVQRLPLIALVGLDAAGLSLFAIAGATKALDYGLSPLLAVLMGAITGVGGGTVRDVLLDRVPLVLHADIYATAALFGAATAVVGVRLGAPTTIISIVGGVACFVLRMVAFSEGWQLPRALLS